MAVEKMSGGCNGQLANFRWASKKENKNLTRCTKKKRFGELYDSVKDEDLLEGAGKNLDGRIGPLWVRTAREWSQSCPERIVELGGKDASHRREKVTVTIGKGEKKKTARV